EGGLSLSSNSKAVDVSQGSLFGLVTGSAGTHFSVVTGSSGISAGQITANRGSISLVAGTGLLSLASGAALTSTNGNITLENVDLSNGSIELGAGATLHAASTTSGVGQVQIFLGLTPARIASPVPLNVSINTSGGANVFFGRNGITALSPTNTLN